ncbi:MAG: hypothetical protein CM15mP22_1170 [Gammaproteobacteria bacterium]|nr:MAG: hypothetical protein CM15mP22_1170 [Gammaproteobacteria bacterium]
MGEGRYIVYYDNYKFKSCKKKSILVQIIILDHQIEK